MQRDLCLRCCQKIDWWLHVDWLIDWFIRSFIHSLLIYVFFQRSTWPTVCRFRGWPDAYLMDWRKVNELSDLESKWCVRRIVRFQYFVFCDRHGVWCCWYSTKCYQPVSTRERHALVFQWTQIALLESGDNIYLSSLDGRFSTVARIFWV